MTLDRRISSTKASTTMKGNSPGVFASVRERRFMKKVAQPEHAYTGCVPYTPADDESDVLPKKKNPPILGYRGHLRHDEDRIGTTFTQGLSTAPRAAVLPLSSAKGSKYQRQIRFAEETPAKRVAFSPRSGYDQFDEVSGYGNFVAPPAAKGKNGMSPRSGYGAFDNVSGYGAFAAPPGRGDKYPDSGYGEFENASGYGAFAAPGDAVMSARSGYGEFDNASGYGAFAAPPAQKPEPMSARSGYGAFDNASGYGEFAAPPQGMSPRSGYGEFDNASGYGAFAAPPAPDVLSPRLGSGRLNGKLASPPEQLKHVVRISSSDQTPGQVARCNPVDNKWGSSVKHSTSLSQEQRKHHNINQPNKSRTSPDLDRRAKYQLALSRVGGEQAALRLWVTAAQTIWQRHMMRTELLQAVKRSFEKHERMNDGFMTKSQLKEALRDLSCVFTDDQITALFGMYDNQLSGVVAMAELLVALTDRL